MAIKTVVYVLNLCVNAVGYRVEDPNSHRGIQQSRPGDDQLSEITVASGPNTVRIYLSTLLTVVLTLTID